MTKKPIGITLRSDFKVTKKPIGITLRSDLLRCAKRPKLIDEEGGVGLGRF